MSPPIVNKDQTDSSSALNGTLLHSSKQIVMTDAVSGHQSQQLPSPTNSDREESKGINGEHGGDLAPAGIEAAILQMSKCHGRVQDLESMVNKTWWNCAFDDLYLRTDADVVEDPAITLEEIRMLESRPAVRAALAKSNSFVSADGVSGHLPEQHQVKVLDLCCGQGRHSLLLAELYPNLVVYGHDQSQYLIDLARSRTEALQLRKNESSAAPSTSSSFQQRVHFSLGDSRSTPFADQQFDLVLFMGNSFGYFANEQEDVQVLKEITRVLKPGGVVVLDIVDGGFYRENFKPRGWEWVDDEMVACRERCLSADRKRIICRELAISTKKGIIRDQFYQERLYDLEEIRQLMSDVGLVLTKQSTLGPDGEDIHQQGQCDDTSDINTKGKEMSQRGEELGMMEQRQFLTGIKPL